MQSRITPAAHISTAVVYKKRIVGKTKQEDYQNRNISNILW